MIGFTPIAEAGASDGRPLFCEQRSLRHPQALERRSLELLCFQGCRCDAGPSNLSTC
jgi:hypothetical protein